MGVPGTRTLASLAALTALAVPATAGAGSLETSGAAKGEPFSARFTVVSQDGKPVAIKNFRFENLMIRCDEGKFLLSSRIKGQFPVNGNGRFHATATEADPPSEVRLRGRFVNPHKVEGRIRAEGSYDDGAGGGTITNCSGSRRYTAS